ncbi:hypothetical protein Hanom_Chr14g01246091 [Helianthus anomalus]
MDLSSHFIFNDCFFMKDLESHMVTSFRIPSKLDFCKSSFTNSPLLPTSYLPTRRGFIPDNKTYQVGVLVLTTYIPLSHLF